MAADPRTPVIAGVGQVQRRPAGADDLAEPLDLMVEAVRAAAADSGPGGDRLLASAGSVRVVESLSWRTPNPAALVAARLGISPREHLVTATGGNSPQMLVNDTAAAIARGDLDVAVIVGAEAMYSRRQARKVGARVEVTPEPEGTPPARVLGDDRFGSHPAELARNLTAPIQVYPLFESALAAAHGRTVDEQRRLAARLWSRFSHVAASNPHAWTPTPLSPEQVGEPTADNRMIGFPYTKLMNANMQVDQGAALVLASLEAARAAGVADDRLVFPWAGADATDHWFVSERADLHSSPAIAAVGRATLELAGVGVDDLAHVDLYSCFPCAVQIAAHALGLPVDDDSRPLSLTGGLTFAGGPGNNYVTHSIATLVDRLRHEPGTVGMVTANGWYVTKHAAGVYGTTPPAEGFRATKPQAEVDALPRREVADDHDGPVTLEAFTVLHDRDGAPEVGVVAGLADDGRRAWANTRNPAEMEALMAGGLVGTRATFRSGGELDLG